MGTIGSRNDARKVHRGKGREEEKSGRYYRPEKEERSEARDKEKPQWARLVRAIMREKCTEEREGREKGIADTSGTKNIKFYFIERKIPKKFVYVRFFLYLCTLFVGKG